MKRLIVIGLIVLLVLTGCSQGDASSADEKSTAEEASPSVEDAVVAEEPAEVEEIEYPELLPLVQELSDTVGGGEVIQMTAAFIQAEEGASFLVGEEKYEVYRFRSRRILTEAESGTLLLEIPGFEETQVQTSRNGSYVLLGQELSTAVVEAFQVLDLP